MLLIQICGDAGANPREQQNVDAKKDKIQRIWSKMVAYARSKIPEYRENLQSLRDKELALTIQVQHWRRYVVAKERALSAVAKVQYPARERDHHQIITFTLKYLNQFY